jgi:polyferredoxin/uncharacterized protein with FMN-binding domain
MKIFNYKISILQIIRFCVQLAFFFLLPAIFIMVLSGLNEFYVNIFKGKFLFGAQFPMLVSAIAVIPFTVLIGRFFCGWMCAFGTIQDFIYHISCKIFKYKVKINNMVDYFLKLTKYVILLSLIIFVWTLNVNIFNNISPWDAFAQLPDIGSAFRYYPIGLAIFGFIIIASIFIERFFCRYLCPLGAVFSIISKIRILKINKPSQKCGKCRVCTKSCSMGIALYKRNYISSGECIMCMKCITNCPRKNMSVSLNGSSINPAIASAVAISAINGIYFLGSFVANANSVIANTSISNTSSLMTRNNTTTPSNNDSNSSVTNSSNSPENSSKKTKPIKPQVAPSKSSSASTSNKMYYNGTYSGSGTGFRDATTTVSVTINNDKVTNVSIVSYGDSPRYFQYSEPIISEEVLARQSSNIDVVSGATFSSRGIIAAVADALSKAKKQ